MQGYLSADIIYAEKLDAIDNVQEQISVHIFATIGLEAVVFIILEIFFATCTSLKLGEYSQIFLSLSRRIFGPVMCLDQLIIIIIVHLYSAFSKRFKGAVYKK